MEITYNFKNMCDKSVNVTIKNCQNQKNNEDDNEDCELVQEEDPLLLPMFDEHELNERNNKTLQLRCKLCDRLFKSATGLEDHTKRHTENKYNCQSCKLVFIALSHYKEHLQLLH